MPEEKGLETLQVWQRGIALAIRVHREALPRLPKDEKWAMESQLRRAVQSIPANIAEGYGRYYYQEGVRFCYIARGSTEECLTFLTLAFEFGYMPEDLFKSLSSDLHELQRLINGYIAFLKKSKRGSREPGANRHLREARADYSFDIDIDEPST